MNSHIQGYAQSKINALTPGQVEFAHELRLLRLRLGMTTPNFAKVAGISAPKITMRELFKVAWREPEIELVLSNIRLHLIDSLEKVELLKKALSPKNNPKSQ